MCGLAGSPAHRWRATAATEYSQYNSISSISIGISSGSSGAGNANYGSARASGPTMARPGQRRVRWVCRRCASATLAHCDSRTGQSPPARRDRTPSCVKARLSALPPFFSFPRPHTRSRSHNPRAQRQAGTQHAPCAFSFLCRRGERVMIAALRFSTGRCSRWTSRETYSCAVASPSGTDRAPLTLCAARAWRSLRSLFVCLFVCLFACCQPK